MSIKSQNRLTIFSLMIVCTTIATLIGLNYLVDQISLKQPETLAQAPDHHLNKDNNIPSNANPMDDSLPAKISPNKANTLLRKASQTTKPTGRPAILERRQKPDTNALIRNSRNGRGAEAPTPSADDDYKKPEQPSYNPRGGDFTPPEHLSEEERRMIEQEMRRRQDEPYPPNYPPPPDYYPPPENYDYEDYDNYDENYDNSDYEGKKEQPAKTDDLKSARLIEEDYPYYDEEDLDPLEDDYFDEYYDEEE